MGAILLAQPPEPEVVRRTAQEVLEQADYAVVDGPSLIDRLVRAVLEQLGRLLLRFGGEGGEPSIWATAALVLVLIAIVVGVVVFVLRLRRSRTLDPVVEGPVGRSAVDWAAEAERHEAAGDLREALRCRYRETLAHLTAAQLVEEIPGRTTGEYARAVRDAAPGAAPAFDELTRAFEDTWYGGQAVDADRMARIREVQRAVASAAGLRTRARAGVGPGT